MEADPLADGAVNELDVRSLRQHAPGPRIALAHDYLSERGGAERVVISLTRAFPGVPLYTSVYDAARYPELEGVDVRPSGLNRIAPLRPRHRVTLPVLPMAYRRFHVDADVVLCSSSGWSHGISTEAPKVVYCHNPPRWIYQRLEYSATRKRYWLASRITDPYLRRWDQKVSRECHTYIANSSTVARRIREIYGREAEVVPPPTTLDTSGPQEPVAGLEPGYLLSVGRLLAYKNVDKLIEAFRQLPGQRLVIVGDGPLRPVLTASAPKNVVVTGRVSDEQLRWLYANCACLVSAAREDFGLTPVEAALYGKPSAVVRAGGFLDTTVEGTTGVFIEGTTPEQICDGVREMLTTEWASEAITKSAERFSEEGFGRRLREIVISAAAGIV